jgi:tetratricopeptide (TPR) repeat protein
MPRWNNDPVEDNRSATRGDRNMSIGWKAILLAAMITTSTTAAADDLSDCLKGKDDTRIAACNRVIASETALSGDRVSALVVRAEYHRRHALDAAINDYGQAIHLDPTRAVLYSGRANTFLQFGKIEPARADRLEAIKIRSEEIKRAPNDPWSRLSRGSDYLSLGDFDRAIEDFDGAIRLNADRAIFFQSRGLANFYKGELSKAHADLSEAISLDPKIAVYRTIRGRVYESAGQPDYAIVDHTAALEIDPKLILGWANRGRAYEAKGEAALARADFEAAAKLSPTPGASYVFTGHVLEQAGLLERALAEFEAALKLTPTLPSALEGRERVRAAIAQSAQK